MMTADSTWKNKRKHSTDCCSTLEMSWNGWYNGIINRKDHDVVSTKWKQITQLWMMMFYCYHGNKWHTVMRLRSVNLIILVNWDQNFAPLDLIMQNKCHQGEVINTERDHNTERLLATSAICGWACCLSTQNSEKFPICIFISLGFSTKHKVQEFLVMQCRQIVPDAWVETCWIPLHNKNMRNKFD